MKINIEQFDRERVSLFVMLVLITLNSLDFLITSLLLDKGVIIELNPLLGAIIETHGIDGLFFVKQAVSLLLICFVGIKRLFRLIYFNKTLIISLYAIASVYFIVVCYSIIGLIMIGG